MMTTIDVKKEGRNSNEEEQEIETEKEEKNLYDAFEYEMEQLFKSVENQHEMLRMKAGTAPEDWKAPAYNPSKAQMYKEKVKGYTKYFIGRKIPENVSEFTEE